MTKNISITVMLIAALVVIFSTVLVGSPTLNAVFGVITLVAAAVAIGDAISRHRSSQH